MRGTSLYRHGYGRYLPDEMGAPKKAKQFKQSVDAAYCLESSAEENA